MAELRFYRADGGIEQQEMNALLENGFIYLGRMALKVGPTIATLGQQLPVGVLDHDVWIQPEPTVPARAVAGLLVAAKRNAKTLDEALSELCIRLLGMPFSQLLAQATQIENAEVQ